MDLPELPSFVPERLSLFFLLCQQSTNRRTYGTPVRLHRWDYNGTYASYTNYVYDDLTASGHYAFTFTATEEDMRIAFYSYSTNLFTLDNIQVSIDHHYTADVISYADYSPYGMLLQHRHGQETNSDYRYGFQGQEMDDEIKGEGNSINYEYRMHDPRIGRFFAVDPLAPKYPEWTPYAFSGNQVTVYRELEGLEPEQRLDENGNVIPETIGTVRAGVPGGNTNINNSWRAYRWEKKGSDIEGWVDLGEIWVDDRWIQGDHVPTSSEVLPKGLSDVEISQVSGNTYRLDAFTLKSGERFRRAWTSSTGNLGFWNATGGMYSGIFDSDGSYAGNRLESRKLKSYYHKDAFNVKITDDLWKDYLRDAGKGVISDLFENLLYRRVDGPINMLASSDNYLDKQIRAFLMSKEPGSYLQMPTGMAVPGEEAKVFSEYWFIGYIGEDFTPCFKIVNIPYEETLIGKPNNGQQINLQ